MSALSNASALALLVALVLKVTLVLAGAAAAVLLLRWRGASAAARHLVWTLAVGAVLAIPLFALALPEWPLHVLRRPAAAAVDAAHPFEVPPAAAASAVAPRPTQEPLLASAPAKRTDAADASVDAPRLGVSAAAWLVPLLYLAGVLAVLLRLLAGRWGVARIARRAKALDGPEWSALLRDLEWLMEVRRPVQLLRGSDASMPMTWGLLRARVLLPAECTAWSEERRRVVLLHELAHVARYDCLIQTVATLACALYWFHPGAWYAARQLRVERELACDDRVLSAGTRAREYAEHLLEVARGFRPALLAGPVAVSMARPSQLEGRLLAVLDGLRNRAAPTRRAATAGAFAALLLVLPLAALRPDAAQQRPASAAALRSDSLPWRVKHKPPRSSDSYPDLDAAMAAGIQDRAFAAAPGERLTLRLPHGVSARVQGWERAQVHLRVDDPALRIDAERVSGGVRVSISGQPSREGAQPAVRLQVPARFDVDAQADQGGLEIRDVSGRFSGSTRGGGLAFVNARGTVRIDAGGGGAYISHSHLDGRLELRGGGAMVDDNSGGLDIVGAGAVVHGSPDDLRALGDRVRSIVTGTDDVAQEGDPRVVAIARPGGDIRIQAAPAGANLSTGGGDIVVSSAGGPVLAGTGSGDVILERVGASATATTAAGDVTVQLVGEGGDVRASSGDGAVTLYLPADFDGDLELESGYTSAHPPTRIISDFPLANQETRGGGDGDPRVMRAVTRLRNGRYRVRVKAMNGDVRVVRGGGAAAAPVRASTAGAAVSCSGGDCVIDAAPARAHATRPATIRGRVLDAQGDPVAGVMVRIVSLGVGATSRDDGRYLLVIPASRLGGGRHEVRVEARKNGFASTTQAVRLAPESSVERDLTLRREEVSVRPRGGDPAEMTVGGDANGYAFVTGDVAGRIASLQAMARSAPAASAASALGYLAFAERSGEVRQAAVLALAGLANGAGTAQLRRIAREHGDPALRQAASAALRAGG